MCLYLSQLMTWESWKAPPSKMYYYIFINVACPVTFSFVAPPLLLSSLVCAVSYTTQFGEKLYFRKFFKFQVNDDFYHSFSVLLC